MASGGARARSGPAPSASSIRQSKEDWTTLPAEGRDGPPPDWPLVDPTDRELDLWVDLWTRPQAVMWERLGLGLEVALHVRTLAEAEVVGAATTVRTLCKQQQEALGLSKPGMDRNHWLIAAPEAGEKQGPRRRSARNRLSVVSGDG